MWHLVRSLSGQLRIADGGMSGLRVVGFDFAAAMALAGATGLCRAAVAVFLPQIEAVAVRKMNEQITEAQNG